MKLNYLLLGLLILPLFATAQGWNPVGSRSAALAHTSVCLDDAWAYFHNPGATASIKTLSAGIYYDTRFLTKEMQTQALALAIPLKKGVLSGGAQFYGYEQYRNTRAGLGYAMQFSEVFQFGIQGNVQTLRLGGNYGNTISGTMEAGLLAKLNSKWQIGLSVVNIGRQKINPLNDRFTTVMRGGFIYKPSSKVHLLAEIEKQVITKISFKGGIEYMPVDQFVIRFGAHSGPMEMAFGFGYKNKTIALDLHTQYHPILGWSPGIGLNYQLVRNENN